MHFNNFLFFNIIVKIILFSTNVYVVIGWQITMNKVNYDLKMIENDFLAIYNELYKDRICFYKN